MNFEDLQNNWKAQPVKDISDTNGLKSALQSKWQKNQRMVMQMNIKLSLMLLATLIGIGWVYFSYREDFGLPFAISIITMYVLILVYSIVSWRSYAFKKENLEESSTSYISYQLQKLNWQRKTLTTYIWIYTFLLWLAVILYELEVADRGTVLFKFTLIGITTAYLFGITAWSRFKKPQKHLAEIDEIVIELKNIQKSLND